jgi:hypothetical protein
VLIRYCFLLPLRWGWALEAGCRRPTSVHGLSASLPWFPFVKEGSVSPHG